MAYMRLNQAKGQAEFGESADNMTGILVYFDRVAVGGDGSDGDGDGGADELGARGGDGARGVAEDDGLDADEPGAAGLSADAEDQWI